MTANKSKDLDDPWDPHGEEREPSPMLSSSLHVSGHRCTHANIHKSNLKSEDTLLSPWPRSRAGRCGSKHLYALFPKVLLRKINKEVKRQGMAKLPWSRPGSSSGPAKPRFLI